MEQKPQNSQIEIAVFGNGFGESVIIHAGDNDWIIIDSCTNSDGEPVALDYLKRKGVAYSDVKLLVATHWHDDHIKGISKIFDECHNAKFVCSGALQTRDFLTVTHAYGSNTGKTNTLLKEFYSITQTMRARGFTKSQKCKTPTWACANRPIWTRKSKNTLLNCEVIALYPSDEAITSAHLEIGQLIPTEGMTRRSFPPKKTNDYCVVLLIKIGECSFLLGSDLQESDCKHKGWSIILSDETIELGESCFFKVPHHGSLNAHHDDIWEKVLTKDPLCILTPFSNGKNPIPTSEDIERVCSFSSQSFIAKSNATHIKTKMDKISAEFIKSSTKSFRKCSKAVGCVLVKGDLGLKNYNVTLHEGAMPLCTKAS